jgi:hypothetical protein
MFQPGRNEAGSFVLFPDLEAVRGLVDDFIAGVWPIEPDQPSCP